MDGVVDLHRRAGVDAELRSARGDTEELHEEDLVVVEAVRVPENADWQDRLQAARSYYKVLL